MASELEGLTYPTNATQSERANVHSAIELASLFDNVKQGNPGSEVQHPPPAYSPSNVGATEQSVPVVRSRRSPRYDIEAQRMPTEKKLASLGPLFWWGLLTCDIIVTVLITLSFACFAFLLYVTVRMMYIHDTRYLCREWPALIDFWNDIVPTIYSTIPAVSIALLIAACHNEKGITLRGEVASKGRRFSLILFVWAVTLLTGPWCSKLIYAPVYCPSGRFWVP